MLIALRRFMASSSAAVAEHNVAAALESVRERVAAATAKAKVCVCV